eukprot:CAMPEP_0197021420 /NCGR_PEP_ID=MMETSP1384-20130603/2288_1 /TAXON_ID=29189 /ORGANISM="Ammonia sp." /LENGTH=435 /DNA_ID=CAMNT_0042449239 /DNA_START=38 /DNA_END=1345 /DNA_ORIENTATION=-
MAQKEVAQDQEEDDTKPRENYVGDKPLDYSKWDALEYESDEDDCHPNIEIGTWRRLKERMRREKGIKKKEPHLVDKWNVTTTNKKYTIDPAKPPKTSEEQKQDAVAVSANTDQLDAPSADNKENQTSTDKPTDTTSPPRPQPAVPAASAPSAAPTSSATTQAAPKQPATTVAEPEPPAKPTQAVTQQNEEEDDPYIARSNPQLFLDENLDKLRKFAGIKNDGKADRFLKKNPGLVHEAAEGFLITHAVDRAVEGAQKPELARLSRRCLSIHNLVQSCSQQNVAPELGVERFYAKIESEPRLQESYKKELNKQVQELMERIEIRRLERLAEMQEIPEEYDDEEKAPLGPGGLDPTDVLNSLPKVMQDAFINQDIEGLKLALNQMEQSEAEYHMRRCIDSGLWVQPDDGQPDENDGQEAEVEAQQEAQSEPKQADID